jgi:hypothetical protein
MRRGIKRLTPVSLANGQAIPGQARPELEQSTFKRELNFFLVSSNPWNPRLAVPGRHQYTGPIHAMRLTSSHRSLQSP